MDKTEVSHQWRIATFAVIGALIASLIGGLFTLLGSYYVLDQQQKLVSQQQIEEQRNIARALYTEISRIENHLNSSISMYPKKEDLDNPNFTAGFDVHLYDNNGLYYVFNKEISRFDDTISTSMYDFYSHIIDIDNKMEFLNTYEERHLVNGSISNYSKYLAHAYTVFILTNEIPYCIAKAENLKQELRQKYKVDATTASYSHNVTALVVDLS